MTPRRPRLALPRAPATRICISTTAPIRPPTGPGCFRPISRSLQYRQVQARTGLQRVVLVQPVTYGFDNRCILDKAAEFGDDARAVVTVPVATSDAELAALWRRGARGLRFHQMRGGMMDWAELPVMAGRIRGSAGMSRSSSTGSNCPSMRA
jgi:hypothetical protein